MSDITKENRNPFHAQLEELKITHALIAMEIEGFNDLINLTNYDRLIGFSR